MPTTAEQLKNVLKVNCKLIQTLPVWLCPWALCYPAGYSGKANENEWDAENGKRLENTWRIRRKSEEYNCHEVDASQMFSHHQNLSPGARAACHLGLIGVHSMCFCVHVCVWGVCWQGSPTATAADVAVACFFLLKWSGKRRSVRGGSRQAAVVTVVATSNSSGRK